MKEGTEQKEKTRYQQVIDGDVEPQGMEKGWLNIREGQKKHNFAVIPKEKAREIQRKGAEAVNKLHGEKKTARESLEQILTLKVTDEIIEGADVPPEIAARLKRDNPEATLYDLIQIVAVGRAVSGSIPAMQYVRDTHGDKPVDHVQIEADITTDADRELLAQIAGRLEEGDRLEIVRDISEDQDGE